MNQATQILRVATGRTELELYNPPVSVINTACWKINGYGASIIIWTSEEWGKLTDPPGDAQYYPCGVWCALRMD